MSKPVEFALTLLAAVLLMLGVIAYVNYENQEKIDAKTKIENELRTANVLLEQRLTTSERGRMVLVLRIDSLRDIVKPLVRVNRQLDSTLTKVKGVYNNRTVTQLETEMISRWREVSTNQSSEKSQ